MLVFVSNVFLFKKLIIIKFHHDLHRFCSCLKHLFASLFIKGNVLVTEREFTIQDVVKASHENRVRTTVHFDSILSS